ncbi:helix-turn-helix domain-containing protein [Paenibacillus chartarius]|uniref:Helix-turn-helix domain-containing protein n=1 Tax=Paenibacillus chartarius TaxID=747481 RepID=A0ABV6DL87_9BACL
MIKAMVVDDERLVRKGFISLVDWASYGIVIVGEAADGKSALELLQHTEVDLLFTDITMPGMSGFDFMKQVRQLYPHIHSVVLTCHHEFDYIQEAIRLGAIDYIVKTLLEMESVDKVMRRIVERIEWEAGSRRIHQAVKLDRRIPAKEALWFRPVAGPPLLDDLYRLSIVQRNTLIEEGGSWLAPLIHSASREQLVSDVRQARLNWQAVLLTDVQDRPLETVVPVVKEHADVLLFYVSDASELVRVDMNELLSRKRSSGAAGAAGMAGGASAAGTAGTAGAAGAASVGATGGGLEAQLLELKWTLFAADWDGLLRRIDEQRPAPELFSRVGKSLCQLWGGYALLREEAEQLASAAGTNRIWPEWKLWLHRFADGVKGRMLELGLSKEVMYSLIRAMSFMRDRAGDKINQKDVAAHINMSRSYFSQCFARFAGETFGELLRRLRMEQAKELLLGSDYPVYEIAARAGFEDEKYFSRLFRELVGISPSEYRSRNAKT